MSAVRKTFDWRFFVVLALVLGVAWLVWTEADAREEADRESIQDRKALATRLNEVEAARNIDAQRLLELGQQPTPVKDAPKKVEDLVASSGPPGRGITNANVQNGDLILTFTDGDRVNVGRIVGANGNDGADGAVGLPGSNGRGITRASVVNGELILTYSDGTTSNLGRVRGADGDRGKDGDSPPCLNEPRQCRGQDGASIKGDKGDTGDTLEPQYGNCPSGQYVWAVHVSAAGKLSTACKPLPIVSIP